MVIPANGEIVLVPFPFSDLSQTKVRPAICLADVHRGDWILCQITSNPYGDSFAIELSGSDFSIGSLRNLSYARPGKLFTAHVSLLIRSVGRLNSAATARIQSAVLALFQQSSP